MQVRVQIDASAVVRRLKALPAEAERALDATISELSLTVKRDIVRSMQRGPKTGRLYRRRSVNHRASREGQAPAVDTGALVSSITVAKSGRRRARVYSRLKYAAFLESGTRRMGARPAWTPARRAAERAAQRVLEKRLASIIRGRGA